MAPSMPIVGAREAPSFDGQNAREIVRYFCNLDRLFGCCEVNDNAEKKQYACDYVNIDISDAFQTVAEYSGQKTGAAGQLVDYLYQEFKQAVLKLYPGASDHDQQYVVSDLSVAAGEFLAAKDFS